MVCKARVVSDNLGKFAITSKQPISFTIVRGLQASASQDDGSKLIKIKATGESRVSFLDDKEVWIEAVIVLDQQGNIANLKWGDQKGFMPPGATNLQLLQSTLAR